MAFSAGLVWLGRALRARGLLPQRGQIEPEARERRERLARLSATADEIARDEQIALDERRSALIAEAAELDDAAREDALRDLHAGGDDEPALEFDTRRDPDDIDPSEVLETARSTEHVGSHDEPYDALDPEDVGAEWLLRATASAPLAGRDPIDALEGTIVFDPPVPDPSVVTEDAAKSGRSGEPMARHAGTREDDIAATLPVGSVDDAGNVELHAPILPPDALNAPPTSTLSPTEKELARRAAAREAARRERG
jgi:hypothetical protein